MQRVVTKIHAKIAALILGMAAFGTMVATQSFAGWVVVLGPFAGALWSNGNNDWWEVVRFVLYETGPYLGAGVLAQFLIKPSEIGNVWRYTIWGFTCIIWVLSSIFALFSQMG